MDELSLAGKSKGSLIKDHVEQLLPKIKCTRRLKNNKDLKISMFRT